MNLKRHQIGFVCRWHEIGLGFLLVILDGGLCDFRSNNRFLSIEVTAVCSHLPYITLLPLQMRFLSFFSKPTLPSPYKPITLHSLHIFSETFLGLLRHRLRHETLSTTLGCPHMCEPLLRTNSTSDSDRDSRMLHAQAHMRRSHSLICPQKSSSSYYSSSSFSIPMCNNEK